MFFNKQGLSRKMEISYIKKTLLQKLFVNGILWVGCDGGDFKLIFFRLNRVIFSLILWGYFLFNFVKPII